MQNKMKERPILFSAPMVIEILDGKKTQTRRIVNRAHGIGLITDFQRSDTTGYDWSMRDKRMRCHDLKNSDLIERCSYGKPCDRLWVRETFAHDFEHNRYFYRADCDDDVTVPYLINGCGLGGGVGNAQISKWKPSIHMPRSASRILLEITGVRVERLQDISEDDAIAEGAMPLNKYRNKFELPHQSGFHNLWMAINGPGSWDLNPWVWVVEFKVLEINK